MEEIVEYEAGEHYSARFVFMVAKASSQLGIDYRLAFRSGRVKTEEQLEDGHCVASQNKRWPVVQIPPERRDEVERRALFLFQREEQSLPVDPLPDGSWPASDDEFAEPLTVSVSVDREKNAVVLDMGRVLRAVALHPSAARSLAMWLMAGANDADGMKSDDDTVQAQIAYVKSEDGDVVRQAQIVFGDLLGDTLVDESSERDDDTDKQVT